MPKSKKEEVVYGACMSVIMVYFMVLLNVCIHSGGVNLDSIMLTFKAFLPVFIAVIIIENLAVDRVKNAIVKRVSKVEDSPAAQTVITALCIVTMMSMVMTIVGSMIGGESFNSIIAEYFTRWPRNFCAAMFVNLAIATPVSRTVVNGMHKRSAAAA